MLAKIANAKHLVHQSDGSNSKIYLPNDKCVYALRYLYVYHKNVSVLLFTTTGKHQIVHVSLGRFLHIFTYSHLLNSRIFI